MHQPIDLDLAERELTRWLILLALDSADSLGASEAMLLAALREALPFLAPQVLRHECRYLAGRSLIHLALDEGRAWRASITAAGTDLVEYRADCPPGIARPAKGYGI